MNLKLHFSPQMDADVTRMNTDALTFSRMWDKQAHPANHQSFQLNGSCFLAWPKNYLGQAENS
jgi:hypothetical protein